MSPRNWHSRGLGPTTVQRVHVYPIADEHYVAERAWERAVLGECPFHPAGGCGVAGHGSYPRVHPPGMRVARFWCSLARRSISLLPLFLAARLPSTLDEIEAVLDAVEAAPSIAAAADVVRPAESENAVTSISAARWVVVACSPCAPRCSRWSRSCPSSPDAHQRSPRSASAWARSAGCSLCARSASRTSRRLVRRLVSLNEEGGERPLNPGPTRHGERALGRTPRWSPRSLGSTERARPKE